MANTIEEQRNSVVVHSHVPSALAAELRVVAKREGRSTSNLIRRALNDFLSGDHDRSRPTG